MKLDDIIKRLDAINNEVMSIGSAKTGGIGIRQILLQLELKDCDSGIASEIRADLYVKLTGMLNEGLSHNVKGRLFGQLKGL